MPSRKRPGSDWYSPYFAPSTIVVGIAVIVVSVQTGRYVGTMMMERDKSRYAPPTQINLVEPAKLRLPAKPAHHAVSHRTTLSPTAKTTR